MADEFTVHSEVREGVEVFTLVAPEGTEAKIAPSLGNNCFAFRVGEPVLEPVDFDAFLAKPTSYGIPQLFPFPNRIRDGRFEHEGSTFTVDPPRHGFVRDRAWTVEAAGASANDGAWIRCTFDARDYEDVILGQFPSLFGLTVTYRLRQSELLIEAFWENVGSSSMPSGYGIHPYFVLPERGTVQVPAESRLVLVDSLPTGHTVAVEPSYDLRTPRPVGSIALDDIYTDLDTRAESTAECRLVDDERARECLVRFDPGMFPYVVVFTPPEPRRAICIEPNTCPTDAFNLQTRGVESHVLVLEPGQSVDATIAISVKR